MWGLGKKILLFSLTSIPKSIFLHDKVWQSNTASPELLWVCSEPLFSIASFHSGTTSEGCTDWGPYWPLHQAALCSIQPVPPYKATLRQLSDPSGKKIRPFVWSWRIKERVNLIASDILGPTVPCVQGNWDPNHLGLESRNLLLKGSDFCLPVTCVFNNWLFLAFCVLL